MKTKQTASLLSAFIPRIPTPFRKGLADSPADPPGQIHWCWRPGLDAPPPGSAARPLKKVPLLDGPPHPEFLTRLEDKTEENLGRPRAGDR